MDDKIDLETNHDDVSFMRVLLQKVRGLSAVSDSSLVLQPDEEDEEL